MTDIPHPAQVYDQERAVSGELERKEQSWAETVCIDFVPEEHLWMVREQKIYDEEGEEDTKLDMKEVMWKGSIIIKLTDEGSYVDMVARTFTVEPDSKDGGITRGHLLACIYTEINKNLDANERDNLKNEIECSGDPAPDGWIDRLDSGAAFPLIDLCEPRLEKTLGFLCRGGGEGHFTLILVEN